MSGGRKGMLSLHENYIPATSSQTSFYLKMVGSTARKQHQRKKLAGDANASTL